MKGEIVWQSYYDVIMTSSSWVNRYFDYFYLIVGQVISYIFQDTASLDPKSVR